MIYGRDKILKLIQRTLTKFPGKAHILLIVRDSADADEVINEVMNTIDRKLVVRMFMSQSLVDLSDGSTIDFFMAGSDFVRLAGRWYHHAMICADIDKDKMDFIKTLLRIPNGS